jgi:hypothetical protein
MKTKTKTKILKVFAIVAIFLGNSHLMAQTLPFSGSGQTVCVNTLAEPYEVVPTATSTYAWSVVDQATGLPLAPGVADITTNLLNPLLPGDWWITVDWTTPGTYELSFIETDVNTLCDANPVVLTITVEDNANAPIATNPGAICLNDPNPMMTVSTDPSGNGSGVFNWYADATLTTLLATAPTYTDITPLNSPTYPTPGTYDYWVTEESANGCEGSATMVTVTVTGLPAAPTSLLPLPYEACFGDPTNPLMTAVGAGSNFNWYDASGVILPLGTNTSTFTSTEVNPATYTYYVEEVVGSCTSPQTIFTFTINTPPASPLVTPLIAGLPEITICEGETPADFVATTGGAAGIFSWYESDPVANPLAPVVQAGTPFILTPTVPNTYNYWLTEEDPSTGCVSATTTATFTINAKPLLPTVTAAPSATICEFDNNPIFTAVPDPLSTGTGDFYWYDDDPAINPLATLLAGPITTYQPFQVAVGQYPIWIIETNSTTNCEGIALEVIFEITALPVIPLLAINPVEICFGDPNPAILPIGSASGVNLIWYDVDPVANPLTGNVGTASFTPPATAAGNATTVTTYPYWVVDQPGTCTSLPLQVYLQINPLPTPGPIWHN